MTMVSKVDVYKIENGLNAEASFSKVTQDIIFCKKFSCFVRGCYANELCNWTDRVLSLYNLSYWDNQLGGNFANMFIHDNGLYIAIDVDDQGHYNEFKESLGLKEAVVSMCVGFFGTPNRVKFIVTHLDAALAGEEIKFDYDD